MLDFLDPVLKKILYTFFVSMLPVIELRGAIPIGYSLGLEWPVAALVSIVGNMLPVPFILFFIRKIFKWMKDHNKFANMVYRLERRALNKAASMTKKGKLYRYELVALCIFVAIPLPGTGAWTGALIAALLNMRIKYAVPAIFLGVIIAAALVTSATYGLFPQVWQVFAAP